jgi:hypothetical protein
VRPAVPKEAKAVCRLTVTKPQLDLTNTAVRLCEADADCKDGIAHLESGHAAADLGHHTGQIAAQCRWQFTPQHVLEDPGGSHVRLGISNGLCSPCKARLTHSGRPKTAWMAWN